MGTNEKRSSIKSIVVDEVEILSQKRFSSRVFQTTVSHIFASIGTVRYQREADSDTVPIEYFYIKYLNIYADWVCYIIH